MSAVLDEGLALFAGLNVIPKRSFLTEYSCRIVPACYPRLMQHWFDAMTGLGLKHGSSFDLDFHTIPFHGEDALVEKHYVSKRSRRQKGILAFLAQDGEKRFFCYANSDLRKDQQDDEILAFVRFWKERTGKLPEELIFDSKLTTHANLNRLNRQGVQFITLRRRSPQLVHELLARPRSAWRQIELDGVSRHLQDAAYPGRAGDAGRLRRPDSANRHHRPGPRRADVALDQPAERSPRSSSDATPNGC